MYIVTSSQFLSPNVLWSHNVQVSLKVQRYIYLLQFIAVMSTKQ